MAEAETLAMQAQGNSLRSVQIESSWKSRLHEEFEQPYMQALREFLVQEKQSGKVIFPPGGEIFSAFNLTPFDQVKVVILGQDPYHGPGQAHGLSFSVKPGVRIPPSLRNIYLEIQQDLGIASPNHGYLEAWAKQGVLMLNSVLTVEQGRANAHQGKGWEQFTDRVIRLLAQERAGLVFMLWGAYAQRKGQLVDRSRHCVLTSPHPSPLSASRGFFGCRHFSKGNEYLVRQNLAPIDWSLKSH